MSQANAAAPLTKSQGDSAPNGRSPISTFALGTIKTLGYMRIILGAASLIAPQTVSHSFHLFVTPQTAILTEMTGLRDIALGALLLTADRQDKERKELKRLLWAHIGVDAMDAFAFIAQYLMGVQSGAAAAGAGGGALVFLAMGIAGIRSL